MLETIYPPAATSAAFQTILFNGNFAISSKFVHVRVYRVAFYYASYMLRSGAIVVTLCMYVYTYAFVCMRTVCTAVAIGCSKNLYIHVYVKQN